MLRRTLLACLAVLLSLVLLALLRRSSGVERSPFTRPVAQPIDIKTGPSSAKAAQRSPLAEEAVRVLRRVSEKPPVAPLSQLFDEAMALQNLVLTDGTSQGVLIDALGPEHGLAMRSLVALVLGGIKSPAIEAKLSALYLELANDRSPCGRALRVVVLYSLGLRDQSGLRRSELSDLWRHRLYDAGYWLGKVLAENGALMEQGADNDGSKASRFSNRGGVPHVQQFGLVADWAVRRQLMKEVESADSEILRMVALDVLTGSVLANDVADFFYSRLLTSKDLSEATYNLEVLGKAAKSDAVARELLGYLDRNVGRPELTAEVVRTLASLDAPGVAQEIAKRYPRLDERARVAALEAMPLGVEATLCDFLTSVATSGSAKERRESIRFFREMTSPEALVILRRLATEDPDEGVRRTSLEALAWCKGATATELRMLRDRASFEGLTEGERTQLQRSVRILSKRVESK